MLLLLHVHKKTAKRFVQCHVFAQSPPDRRSSDKCPVQSILRIAPDLCANVSLQCYLVATVIHIQSILSQKCVYISIFSDFLDFFVLKNIGLNYTHIEATRDLSSDHTPIILTLSTHTFSKPAIPRLTSPKADWNNFRAHINENTHLIIQLKLPADIDNAVHTFTCLIQEAARRSTPPATPGNGPTNNTSLHIRALVTEKRRARSRWQRSLNPLDKREYNRLTRHLKTSLQDIRNVTFETYISSLSKEDHSIWKATKQFKRPIPHVPPASARRWHLEHN